MGDSAVAETCDSFCTSCGRGHLHFAPCNKHLCGSAVHDGVRHSKRVFADPSSTVGGGIKAFDEYTHEFHWKHMGFEDPVKTAEDLSTFNKCGNYCTCAEHEQVCWRR